MTEREEVMPKIFATETIFSIIILAIAIMLLVLGMNTFYPVYMIILSVLYFMRSFVSYRLRCKRYKLLSRILPIARIRKGKAQNEKKDK